VAQTRATDEAEDQKFGEARGDELPEELRTPEGRREFLRRARQALRRDEEGECPEQIEESDAEPDTEESDAEPDAEAETEEPERAPTPEFEFDAERITDAGGGRRRWLSEAKRQLEQHRWENPDPIVRSRVERLLLALGRLEADLSAERAGNEAYEAYRRQGRMRDGRRFGRPADPYQPPEVPEGKVNVTDPDSRPIPVGFGFVQGYNGQTAVNENQIVLAAEITNLSTDFSQLSPMVNATLQELRRAGIADVGRLLEAVAADAGYWNEQQMDDVINNQHIPVLVAPDKGSRATPKRWLIDGRANWMRTVLKSDDGHRRYAKRKQTVEPLYGDTKHNRGFIRFHRRGRVKVRTEFRLLMMTHNLTKAHRHQIATMAA
jgi:Transposase DDE domain